MYLLLEKGREGERERNTSAWLLLVRTLLGTWLQPRHVPWVGIEPASLWFAGWHSIHWAIPGTAEGWILSNTFCHLFRWRVCLSCFDLLMWKSILICILILTRGTFSCTSFLLSLHKRLLVFMGWPLLCMVHHFNGLLGSISYYLGFFLHQYS